MLEYVRNGHGRPSYYINNQRVDKLTALSYAKANNIKLPIIVRKRKNNLMLSSELELQAGNEGLVPRDEADVINFSLKNTEVPSHLDGRSSTEDLGSSTNLETEFYKLCNNFSSLNNNFIELKTFNIKLQNENNNIRNINNTLINEIQELKIKIESLLCNPAPRPCTLNSDKPEHEPEPEPEPEPEHEHEPEPELGSGNQYKNTFIELKELLLETKNNNKILMNKYKKDLDQMQNIEDARGLDPDEICDLDSIIYIKADIKGCSNSISNIKKLCERIDYFLDGKIVYFNMTIVPKKDIKSETKRFIKSLIHLVKVYQENYQSNYDTYESKHQKLNAIRLEKTVCLSGTKW